MDCWLLAKHLTQISGVNLARYPLTFDRRDPGWGILLLRRAYRRFPTPSRAAGASGVDHALGNSVGAIGWSPGSLLNRGDVPEAGLGSVLAPAI